MSRADYDHWNDNREVPGLMHPNMNKIRRRRAKNSVAKASRRKNR